jgi:thiol-disulfide isomerase/thioredoxin
MYEKMAANRDEQRIQNENINLINKYGLQTVRESDEASLLKNRNFKPGDAYVKGIFDYNNPSIARINFLTKSGWQEMSWDEFKSQVLDEIRPKGSGKGVSLTLYYADWCPHCHTLLPIWKKLGSEYKGIQIIALEEKQTKFKVDGYPTIIFRNGKTMEKYEGERTRVGILNYLKNKLRSK